jgi:hypothetical protein
MAGTLGPGCPAGRVSRLAVSLELIGVQRARAEGPYDSQLPPEFLDLFRQHRQPRQPRLQLRIPGGELRRENLVRRFQLGDPGA